MKSKRIYSFILMGALAFGSIGFAQSQINTAYAMPSDHVVQHVGHNIWHIYGEQSLKEELELVEQKKCCCPYGKEYAKSLINICIRENRTLEVDKQLGQWIYRVI